MNEAGGIPAVGLYFRLVNRTVRSMNETLEPNLVFQAGFLRLRHS